MALSTDTYDNLVAQTSALVGYSPTAVDQRRLDSLFNLAAKRAYRESQWWERYLFVSQPRTAKRGVVEFSEDSFHVYGAGTNDVNGLYVSSSAVNGRVSYKKEGTDSSGNTVAKYDIRWDNSTKWELQARQYITVDGAIVTVNDSYLYEPGDVIYDVTNSSTTPPTGAWDEPSGVEGVTPPPVLVDLADIDTCLEINRYDQEQDMTSRPIPFHVSSRGATLHNNEDLSIVYVTYKSTHTDVYGDGTNSTEDDIPSEWFNYMSLYAARMYQIAERQSNDSPFAVIASREVDEALMDEKMKIEEQGISETVAKRISTNLIYNNSLT